MDARSLNPTRALWLAGPLLLASCAGGAEPGPAQVALRATLREPAVDLGPDALRALPSLSKGQPILPGTPEYSAAMLPLADVLHALAWVPPASPVRPAWSGSEVAMSAYSRGRMSVLAGDAQGAIEPLREATRLDPDAPEPWRELGEVLIATGDRSGGAEALTRAMDLGAHDSRTVLLLASELLTAGKRDEALARLAFGAAQPPVGDPGPRRLIHANLTSLLIAADRVAAAAEACAVAHEDGLAVVARSAYRRELGEMLQRAGQQWTEVSDGFARLGLWSRAADTARQAIESRRGGDELLTDRLVRALLLDGRADEARAAALDALRARAGLLDDRLVILLRGLRDATGVAFGDGALEACDSDDARRGDAFLLWRARVQAATSSPEEREHVLTEAMRRFPAEPDLALDLLWPGPGESDSARVARALRAVGAAPRSAGAIAQALRQVSPSLAPVFEALAALRQPAGALLAARLELLHEHPEAALAHLAGAGDPGIASEAALARVQALAALGELERARLACDDLIAAAPASPWAFEALVAVQRFDEAARLADDALARGPQAEFPAWWARSATTLALSRGEPERAWVIQDARSDADPFDGSLLLARMQRHLPRGPQPDQAALNQIATRLRDDLPGSTVVRRAVTGEFAQRGMFPQAAERAEALARERWGVPGASETLWQVLEAWQRREPGPGAARAMALADEIAREGGDPERATAARARALRISGRLDEAREALVQLAPVSSLFAVELEAFTRSAQRDVPGADALRRARLESSPPSLPVLIERASFYAEQGELAAFADAAEAIPAWCGLLPGQRAALGRAVDDAAAQAAALRDDAMARRWEALCAAALAHGCEVGPASHAYRLSVLALRAPRDAEAIRLAVDQATHDHPSQARALRYAPVRALVEAERLTDAAAAMGPLVISDPLATAEIWDSWIRLAAQAGDDALVRGLADRLPDGDLAREIVKTLGSTPEGPAPADPRADLLYRLAGLLSFIGREDLADEMHERCLAIDPEHVWASNDHGYRLALKGERLDDAERMLVRAARALPENPGIIDSLGWVRYRLGVLRDDVDEAGAVVRESAVTLLSRAATLAGDDANAEVLEHLGDALWQVNRRDEAASRWSQALARAEVELTRIPEGPGGSPQARLRAAAEERIAGLHARLDAAASGVPPPVAPLVRPPN